ncbi:CRISPR-associated endonuclease Cas2 [Dissulfurispira thermophila]|uniref:CRISPR-associated endonuclease Cas2 n=1 Tax=Dissulfurispira thermophila TaxID=2715679 RepID=UPI00193E145C|nr:CRISPR-associated endonuclease Cas2 [Dissulfurispira thermophila]
MNRTLYIIAYDIREPKRLNRVRYFLKGYSTGGQKSVYECFLTDGELKFVVSNLRRMIYDADDRIHIFQLDGRSRTHTLGIALQPKNPSLGLRRQTTRRC